MVWTLVLLEQFCVFCLSCLSHSTGLPECTARVHCFLLKAFWGSLVQLHFNHVQDSSQHYRQVDCIGFGFQLNTGLIYVVFPLFSFKKTSARVVHAFNSSSWEAGGCRAQSQHGIHETLAQNKQQQQQTSKVTMCRSQSLVAVLPRYPVR